MIKQKTRARKCFAHKRYMASVNVLLERMDIVRLTGVMVLVSPIKTHNWTIVRLPTHAIVKSPTHLTLAVAPKPSPVFANQNHQLASNAFEGPSSC